MAKWNLTLSLKDALNDYPENVIALNDSQIIRWIDELNGAENVSETVAALTGKIRRDKKMPRSRDVSLRIKGYYTYLYEAQFIKDYVCVIMDSNSDYDRANKGFTINGIRFRRFLGTNGGIKNSTIVYVNEELYPALKERLDNGRNMDAALVPAKLEAYQALVCSGSVPLPPPNGIIVVGDCVTRFKERVIHISDENEGEPELAYIDDYEIEHNGTDGFGLILPSYAKRVNAYLNGVEGKPVAGFNSRYAWTKGMLYTFDFVEFAEKVAGTYTLTDAWGTKRDVRDAEVILTVSMLKLWGLYESWEDYYSNCEKNRYQFSATKSTPEELESVRTTNYQFLQSYTLTDAELDALCKPTADEVKDVLGLDYKKTLAYLLGAGMDDGKAVRVEDNYIKALMIEPEMINDPYVRKSVYSMIKKRMECAKKGTIQVDGNYAMISGDPYSLCQNMFGMEVTGILKAGEVYHKYWIDKGADEIVCFRAPMTGHNNIRRMKLNRSDMAAHWYQYIDTALIYNAWDSACEAMNGADFDGDTNMCTDNPILLRRTLNTPTIICAQRSAEKKIPSEDDIITANKLAFNDDIGIVTNRVTAMIERQAAFAPDTQEYKTLEYRIMCGQHYQQATIDRAKGVIVKPMPEEWYNYSANRIHEEDSAEVRKKKTLNQRIVASHKPYFMIYVYPDFMKKVSDYYRHSDITARRRFYKARIGGVKDLYGIKERNLDVDSFLKYYEDQMPCGNNDCMINRICRYYEREFPAYSEFFSDGKAFDPGILKSGAVYSKSAYNAIAKLYAEYRREFAVGIGDYKQRVSSGKADDDGEIIKDLFLMKFKTKANEICTNEDELCNIVVDLCYSREGSKQFAWDVAGDVMIQNLLRRRGDIISYPKAGGDEFTFGGVGYDMVSIAADLGADG